MEYTLREYRISGEDNMTREEYLADYCANKKCTDKNGSECDNCMYEKGRRDERKKIMNIVDSGEDMAQAMYLLGQYIIEEELKENK